MPKIEFLNVTKRYEEITAVENLNFTIQDGEYISLLGPSGCGKTTTLRMLSGLVLPTEGTILWDSKPVQDLPPDERSIGYVFQQFAIFPSMNIWENIAYPLQVRGFEDEQIETEVANYLQLVGLTEKANLFPKNVGAADLQRTGVARVLARGAQVLLLDEPFGALDFKVREEFQDELRDIVKKRGLTAIHVTHDQSEGMAISDRIGVMKKGKMIELDSPTNLLFNPKQVFSAHFIGESNFLVGIVIDKSRKDMGLELIGGDKLRITQNFKLYSIGERVVLGFRKSFATLMDRQEDKQDNIIHCIVESDRYLGEKRRIMLSLTYGRSMELMVLPHEKVRKSGDEVSVQIDSNNLMVFKYPDEGLDLALEVT